jgi:hypothetical protein
MLANATRLCEANFGTLNLYDDNGSFPIVAMHNVPTVYADYRRHHPILNVDPRHPLARVAATKQVLQVIDSHDISANASKTRPAKLLAVFVVDTNETELTIPFGK